MKTFNRPVRLETPRLILRQWQARDFEAFADLNADPEVMRYFPATLSKNESDLLAHRFQDSITECGWGFWAVELKENQQFIGFVAAAGPDEMIIRRMLRQNAGHPLQRTLFEPKVANRQTRERRTHAVAGGF